MKPKPSDSTDLPGRRTASLIAAVFFLALFSVRAMGEPVQSLAGENDYRIHVRAEADQKYTTFSKEPLKNHGRRYVIINFEQVKTEKPLVKPVDKAALLQKVQKILSAYGFHPPEAGTRPDLVLTVLYGRSWLRNPYLEKGEGIPLNLDGVQMYSPDMLAVAHQKATPGFAEKVISNNAEKLFIAVIAWKFPETPREKPKEVWRTIMLTDDPDQDLNLAAGKMLAAGGGYFDHIIEKEEVTLPASVAEGHVEVGTPIVVEPAKSK